jgi:hypothetical protein
MTATCRTCGASLPGKHVPSMLDPNGVGDPGHKYPGGFFQTIDHFPAPAPEVPTDPDNERYELLIGLFESGKELGEMYQMHEGDEDWLDFLKITIPKIPGFFDELDAHTARKEKAAYVNEATHRCNDAIERLWRLDRDACVAWYESQAEFYKIRPTEQKLNETNAVKLKTSVNSRRIEMSPRTEDDELHD